MTGEGSARWRSVGSTCGGIAVCIVLVLMLLLAACGRNEKHEEESVANERADRAEAVDRVPIEAGEFVAGCGEPFEAGCVASEKPVRRLALSSFSIDRTEVTVAAYRACVEAGVCSEPDREGDCNYASTGRERHPVNCVDWQQAETYCTWRGGRLPTEWEWERAARGAQGDRFPWGNADVGCTRAVFDDGTGSACDAGDGTSEVGSKPEGASGEGVLDLIGNVWEWTSTTAERSGSRIVRGGAYYMTKDQIRSTLGIPFVPSGRADYVGFRCVYEPSRPLAFEQDGSVTRARHPGFPIGDGSGAHAIP